VPQEASVSPGCAPRLRRCNGRRLCLEYSQRQRWRDGCDLRRWRGWAQCR
jgi:hypothetical protein